MNESVVIDSVTDRVEDMWCHIVRDSGSVTVKFKEKKKKKHEKKKKRKKQFRGRLKRDPGEEMVPASRREHLICN